MSTEAKCSWGLYHLVAASTTFKAVEYSVMDKSGQTLYGASFMNNVFSEEDPIIKVLESGYYYKGMQKGFKHLFIGASQGIRNPKAQKKITGTGTRPILDQDLAVFEKESPIYTHFSTITEVAHHIPMDGGFALAPRLRIARPKSQVDCSADLLIEEYVLGESLYPEIGPKSELSYIACSLVDLQHFQQEWFILSRRGLDDSPILELESDILYLTAKAAGGISISDIPIHTILDGPSEDLPIRKVRMPVAVLPLPTCNLELEIGIGTNDMDLPSLVQPIHQPLLLLRDSPPSTDWIRLMDQATAINEILELAE